MAKTNADNQADRAPVPGNDETKQEQTVVGPPAAADAKAEAAAPAKLEPLTENEKLQLADLERKCKMGRPMDQPSMREMGILKVLRERSKIVPKKVKE